MKSMLHAANLRGPKFDGASAQRWLLAHGELLKPAQQQSLRRLHRHRATHRTSTRTAATRDHLGHRRSERFADRCAAPERARHRRDLGCIIAAEIGPFDRFPNADTLEFWAGLTADMKESAGRTQSGNITKAGSVTLRWALCQAAVTLCQCDARQEAIRQRLVRRIGKPRPTWPWADACCESCTPWSATGRPSSEDRPGTAPRPPTGHGWQERNKSLNLGETIIIDVRRNLCGGRPGDAPRRVGDRDRVSFGPIGNAALREQTQALPGSLLVTATV